MNRSVRTLTATPISTKTIPAAPSGAGFDAFRRSSETLMGFLAPGSLDDRSGGLLANAYMSFGNFATSIPQSGYRMRELIKFRDESSRLIVSVA
jgi:hypothetical protein